MPLDLELRLKENRPHEVSLHQALLLLAPNENWIPKSATVFSCIEGLPPPEDITAKRLLLLAIAEERLQHRGELRNFQGSSDMNQSRRAGELPSTLLDPEYRAARHLWSAERVCFQKSELSLPDRSINVGTRRMEGIFKVTRILVPTDEVVKLRALSRASKGGRPRKEDGRTRAYEFICAYLAKEGPPKKQSELVESALEYSQEGLPKDERINKTTVEEIVRGVQRAIEEYDR